MIEMPADAAAAPPLDPVRWGGVVGALALVCLAGLPGLGLLVLLPGLAPLVGGGLAGAAATAAAAPAPPSAGLGARAGGLAGALAAGVACLALGAAVLPWSLSAPGSRTLEALHAPPGNTMELAYALSSRPAGDPLRALAEDLHARHPDDPLREEVDVWLSTLWLFAAGFRGHERVFAFVLALGLAGLSVLATAAPAALGGALVAGSLAKAAPPPHEPA